MAFRGDSTDTYTYASGSTGGTVDLGARNNYRYVNASNVYNKGKSDGNTTHTQTYTFPSNDTGGTKDLGVNHYYRYVNATNVYNKGKADTPKKTLLWTNPNIADNATFAAQTVNINLTNYNGVVIESYHTVSDRYIKNGAAVTSTVYIDKGTTDRYAIMCGYDYNGVSWGRWISVTNSGVTFSDNKAIMAFYGNTNVGAKNSSAAVDNQCVPRYIYGVR